MIQLIVRQQSADIYTHLKVKTTRPRGRVESSLNGFENGKRYCAFQRQWQLWASRIACLSPPQTSLVFKLAMAPARRPVRVDSGCWSRNLRTNNFSDSDSDSDDSSPTGRDSGLGSSSDRPPPISEDARLIKELDLSSRHDEAVFKPNPWSIAKVNAAARPQVGAAKGPQHAQSPASKRSTGNLEDAFKTQSLRPRDPSATSALKPMSAVERVSSRIANATLPRKGLETGAGSRGLIKQTSSRTQCTPAVSSNSTKSVFPTAYMRRRQASTPSDNTRTAEDPIPSHPNLPEPAQLSSFHGNYQPLPVVAHIPSTMPSSTSRLDDVVRRQGIGSSRQHLSMPLGDRT